MLINYQKLSIELRKIELDLERKDIFDQKAMINYCIINKCKIDITNDNDVLIIKLNDITYIDGVYYINNLRYSEFIHDYLHDIELKKIPKLLH